MAYGLASSLKKEVRFMIHKKSIIKVFLVLYYLTPWFNLTSPSQLVGVAISIMKEIENIKQHYDIQSLG